ncbi:MAG: type II toxin-antitoxin system RelE/ParE family toxin [Pseudomonadota bacterium]
MKVWEIEFYRDEAGREPVAEFLDDLPDSARAKAVRLIELLATYGVLLKEPHTKQVRGKIREIRITDRIGAVRVLYFGYTGGQFILLHGFIKKTDKIPSREIDIAEKRMKDFLLRHEVKK